eukprot:363199-Chlamydomonas_euryale.AAC.2
MYWRCIKRETSGRISSAHLAFHHHTDRIWGGDVLSSDTKLRVFNYMVVTHITYRCQTKALSSHSTDPYKLHPVTVPMAFTLARQRASFIGKTVGTSQQRSNPMFGEVRVLHAVPTSLPTSEDTALSVESNSTLITESSKPPPYTNGMGLLVHTKGEG